MSGSPRHYLGIDHGTRRLGLAYGDEIGVATPLPAIATAEEAKQWSALAAVVAARRITDIVLGLPLNMDGTEGPRCQSVRQFAANIALHGPAPLATLPVTLTVSAATVPMISANPATLSFTAPAFNAPRSTTAWCDVP